MTFIWTADLNSELFPYLNEHCVQDVPVFPCAAYIELSLAAATEVFGPSRFSIENLELKKALFFPRGTTQTLQVILMPETDAKTMSMRFFSAQAGQDKREETVWTLHATAKVQCEEEPPVQETIIHPAPEQVQREWALAMEAELYYQGLRARGIQHGPLFRGVTHVWRRPGEVMSHLTIPAGVTSNSSGYQIHPALIDSFLQGITPFLPEEGEEVYVPVAVKRMKFHQRPEPGAKLWSHAILRTEASSNGQSTIEGDIILLDEQGQVLLEVLGCRLQSLDGETPDFMRQRLKQLLYTIEWVQQTRNEWYEKRMLRKNWLIFSEGPIGQKLAEHLRANGADCTIVTVGQSYKLIGEQQYELSVEAPEEFNQLLKELYGQSGEQAIGVIYLWGMLAPVVNNSRRQLVHASQDLVSIGILHLIQAIAEAKQELSCHLWLVTSGVHVIEEHDRTTGLFQAPLWGLGRVVVYEHQNLHSTLIDLDATPSDECLSALFKEIWSDEEEDEIALRGDRRYAARLARYTVPDEQEQAQPLFRADGTYLITGGLSGVGLRTAQWMIEQGVRYLVLMGRRGVPEDAEATLQAMRKTGACVRVLKGDVAREDHLENVLTRIRREMPPLRGVFHSAVILDDSILLQMSRERFLDVMFPKVDGAWNLHRLTLDDPLDYFVLFSSAASLIGSPGQGNYAAANAFMDILASYRIQHGYPALCINWGRWSEIGQAVKENRAERLNARGFANMKPKEGLTILEHLLYQSPAQVGAMSLNLPMWSQFYPNLTRSSLFTYLLEEPGVREENRAGVWLTSEMLINLDRAQHKPRLALYLNDQIARVLGHTSLSLETHQQINRLGIDSLMAVELKNRIGSDLNVVIPVTTFLQDSTFAQLMTQILEQI
jgi:myxalamid-type polyketide synthase MxaE and MxaD